jgi:hypothetical protein
VDPQPGLSLVGALARVKELIHQIGFQWHQPYQLDLGFALAKLWIDAFCFGLYDQVCKEKTAQKSSRMFASGSGHQQWPRHLRLLMAGVILLGSFWRLPVCIGCCFHQDWDRRRRLFTAVPPLLDRQMK